MNLLDLLYPPRCPICDGPLPFTGGPSEANRHLCPECRQKPDYIHEPYCMRCGKQLETIGQEYCHDCELRKENSQFRRGLAAFTYSERMKPSMYAFKNGGRREYAAFYAEEIDRLYHEAILSWQAECLVPVPLHPAKLRKRGYNQAEDLARALSPLLNLPVRTDLLLKIRNSAPQKNLSEKERKNNAKNTFKLGQSILECRKIILVDDIYTTGMTLNECARPLREAGATEIYFLTACVGRGF